MSDTLTPCLNNVMVKIDEKEKLGAVKHVLLSVVALLHIIKVNKHTFPPYIFRFSAITTGTLEALRTRVLQEMEGVSRK